MSRDTADIVGPTGSKAVITFNTVPTAAGTNPVTPAKATLTPAPPAGVSAPTISGNAVTVTLSAGDSSIQVNVVVPPSGCEARFVQNGAYVILNTLPPAGPFFVFNLFGEQ